MIKKALSFACFAIIICILLGAGGGAGSGGAGGGGAGSGGAVGAGAVGEAEAVGGGTAIIANAGGNKYKAIRLIPAVYNHANGDLSDLRLKDEKGNFVPYFINGGSLTEYESDRVETPMALINSYTKDDSFYFDYKIDLIPDRTVLSTSVEITTGSGGFAKNIEIYGSYDDIYWEFIQNDSIYRIDGVSKLYVEFAAPQKYTHFRFKLGNNLERISFDTVTLVYKNLIQERSYFIESMTPDYVVDEADGNTVIRLIGLHNLRLAEITVLTDSMFKRVVAAPYAPNKELYNLSFDNSSYSDTTVPFYGQIIAATDYALTIYNGDDAPIDVKGIGVKYYADDIVFEDRGGAEYKLSFGADATIRAPVYDIERYKAEVLKGDIDRLEIGSLTFFDGKKPPNQIDYRLIFNAVIAIVAVLLGLLIIMKLRKAK